ncbi:hypothetical protein D3C87_1800210 [compost metagenome]
MMILALVRQQTAAGTGNASIAQAFVRTRCPLLAGSVNQRGIRDAYRGSGRTASDPNRSFVRKINLPAESVSADELVIS